MNVAEYACSLGANGIHVDTHKELFTALDEAAFCSNQTTVIDVPIDPDVITPTSRLSEMLDAYR